MKVFRSHGPRVAFWFGLVVMPALSGAADGPALAAAMEKRDRQEVTRLLAAGADVDAAQPDGMTALLWAAYLDDTDMARGLIAAGAAPDRTNRYGFTPLLFACRNGNAELVAALLTAGSDPQKAEPAGESPLLAAARVGKSGPVRALLAAGVPPDAGLPGGQTPLMWAAADGHTEVVNVLLAAGADLNARLASGFNAWLFAVRGGHTATVQALLRAGSDLNYVTAPERKPGGKQPPAGTSALIVAIENGHFELAAQLVDLGADPNDLRSHHAPLHVLTWVRKPDISEMNGDPPPDGSGRLSSLDLAKHLVARGAKVDLRLTAAAKGQGRYAREGCTPLLLAADRADAAYVKLLVSLGADPTAHNVEGANALMLACGLGNGAEQDEAGTEAEALETVAYLLELGLDPNAVTKSGETAMHGAAYAFFPKVMELLDGRGARIEVWNRPNEHGWTPLRIAEGHRFGNFKPSYEVMTVLHRLMKTNGVEIPPPMERAKPKGYQAP